MQLPFYLFMREAETAQAPVLLKHLLQSAGAIGEPRDLNQPQGQGEGPAGMTEK